MLSRFTAEEALFNRLGLRARELLLEDERRLASARLFADFELEM
jgi:hypothetical protein